MTEVAETETPNGVPQILHEGRYRLYGKPDGGIHLVYKRDDKEEEDHFEIPGQMLRLAQLAGSGEMTFPQFMKEAVKLRRNSELYWSRF